jgi:hypothetical protein
MKNPYTMTVVSKQGKKAAGNRAGYLGFLHLIDNTLVNENRKRKNACRKPRYEKYSS